MAYLVPADFRTATLNEVCTGLSLTATEVPDGNLTAAIARCSQRVDDYTNDHFEQYAGLVLEHDVHDSSYRLPLLKRCTSVTAVKTRDHLGVLTTQAAGVYRLHTSLDNAGAIAIGKLDWLDILRWGNGLSGPDIFNSWRWPTGTQAVQVTGNYGWTTTPLDIKRAVALLVYYADKPIRADLRLAESVTTADTSVRYGTTYPSGIPEADDIIYDYNRTPAAGTVLVS